jgi:hypothetical protein
MFVAGFLLTALFTFPAVPVFYAVLRTRGWKRFLLFFVAFVTAWVLLYMIIDASETAGEIRFGHLELDPRERPPGPNEARIYAILGGWMFAGPYVAWLVHMARIYMRSKTSSEA